MITGADDEGLASAPFAAAFDALPGMFLLLTPELITIWVSADFAASPASPHDARFV